MFTGQNTLNEIMNDADIRRWFPVFYRMNLLDPLAELWNLPLEEAVRTAVITEMTPRRQRDSILETANLILEIREGKRSCLQLNTWEDWQPQDPFDPQSPDSIFLITPLKNETAQSRPRPVLLIAPGGAYDHVSYRNEGTPLQKLAEERGYAAFMIRYRVAPSRYPLPQQDLLTAIRYIRENADRYHADPNRVTIAGFSAGGHLCASAAAQYRELGFEDCRPDAVALGYPVISTEQAITHEGSFRSLLGERFDELRDHVSMEKQIPDDYPPSFVWACQDDALVPVQNALRFAEGLKEKQIPFECHVYRWGGHGIGLGEDTSASCWSEELFRFLNEVL